MIVKKFLILKCITKKYLTLKKKYTTDKNKHEFKNYQTANVI